MKIAEMWHFGRPRRGVRGCASSAPRSPGVHAEYL
jgi:hypothetical protein